MKRLHSLDSLAPRDLAGASVLVRVDFNVPLNRGTILDSTRLEQALPTIRELMDRSGRLLLVSHLGRPKGEPQPELTLRPVAERLAELLGREVAFAEDCIGEPAHKVGGRLAPGEAALLENLRFHAGEEANDEEFARRLAAPAAIYVNDAFGVAHRAHASVVGVAEHLEKRAAGRLLVREVEALGRLLEAPAKPFVAVLGGAKIAGKIDAVSNLLRRLDHLLLGGGMANTFLAARGHDMGRSLVEDDQVETARDLLEQAEARGVQVGLPVDLIVTDNIEEGNVDGQVPVDRIPAEGLAVDIGERTRQLFAQTIREASTLFWNGPLGVFERPRFADGTEAIARAVADCRGFTVVGGGETLAAVRQSGVAERIGHISTGGGASLELLAGRELPGVRVLEAS